MADIAKKYAEAGQFDQALEVARAIEDPYYRSQALTYIAGKYEEAGIKAEASSTLSQSIEAIKTIKDPSSRVSALTEIALTYAKSGMGRKASEILSQALKVAKTEMVDNLVFKSKSRAFANIATKYTEVDQFDRALRVARAIKDPDYKSDALANIAVKYAEAGQFDQALKIVRAIKDCDKKFSALADIACRYAEAGQYDRALEVARTIKDPDYKSDALANIAVKCAQAGMSTQASEILSQAFELAKTTSELDALTNIAVKYAEIGMSEKASAILSEAIELAKDEAVTAAALFPKLALHWLTIKLAEIAKKYAEAGQFNQALELTRGVEDAYYKSQALVYIASKYEEHGKQSVSYTHLTLPTN
mgnify:CR=1 FL=1